MAIDVCCQGKTRLGLTGPTKGGLDKLPEQPESEEDPSDDEDGKRGKSAVELTQGQQDFYWISYCHLTCHKSLPLCFYFRNLCPHTGAEQLQEVLRLFAFEVCQDAQLALRAGGLHPEHPRWC